MNAKFLPILIASAIALSACAGAGPATSPPNTLTAVKVDAAAMDAAASFWANAPKTEIATKAADKSAKDGPKITLQAVYDSKNVVVRAEWADSTENTTRNAWTYNGTAFTRAGAQDRFAMNFPMGNYASFSSKGCAVACHSTDPDEAKWWMGSESPDERYDVWHWKSSETGLVNQVDDQWWGPKDTITSTTGRKNDAGTGGPVTNASADGKSPKFMNGKAPDAKLILSGEEIPLDVTKLKAGAVIPGYVLAPFKGSRGDIASKATFANGKWVLVFTRPLSTGNADDLVFTPPKAVPFGLAVFDNAGDNDHTVSQEVLTLAWK